MISRISPQDFLNILQTYRDTPETILSFPMEYYLTPSSVYLYKTIMNKTYKTIVLLNIPEPLDDDLVINDPVTLFWQGEEITLDQFIDLLKNNHSALMVLEPLDINDIYVVHNHNAHLHAGYEPDDVLS